MNLLLFVIVLGLSLLLERALNAVCFALLYLTGRSDAKPVSMQTTTGIVGCAMNFWSFVVALFLQIVSVAAQWMLTGALTLCLSCLLYVVFEYASDIMFEAGSAYNGGLSASLQILVVWPAKLAAMVFEGVCPVWNVVFWVAKKMPAQVLVQTVTRDLGLLVNACEALADACKASALSLVAWVGSFVCCESTDGFCNERCFEAGERVLDLLRPMAAVRAVALWVATWLRGMCFLVGPAIDLVTYPLMDINLAEGVHFLGNSFLYLTFHVPAMTFDRCSAFKDESVVMCIPDLEPVFAMLATGIRSLGRCVDNWLDVLVLIVEAALGRPGPTCSALPDLLRDFDFKRNFFGANATVMVGMTELMFARTDGWGVQYFSLARDWQTVVHPSAFPFPVDVSYGLAAVSHITDADHDAGGDDTTALLGCTCSQPFQLQCAVARFSTDGGASVPLSFQLPSTAGLLTCDKVAVRVQSIRWPVSRYTSTRVQRPDGSFLQDPGCKGSACLQADAAIWVRPMCSVDVIDPVCVESFKQAACFPYCMALHVRGSGTLPLVLHSAGEWGDGVALLKRDCGLFNMVPGQGGPVNLTVPGSKLGLSERAPVGACTYNAGVNTMMVKAALPTYAQHASVDLASQPFLFAGDVALTAVAGQLDANGQTLWSIRVQRIFGNQANEFTVVPLNQGIPSSGPCRTPDSCDMIVPGKAAIPYGYEASANAGVLGTTSDHFLFWVTNPTLEPFYAFASYCKNVNSSRTNKVQISVTSSYGGVRLWRIDPYVYCPVDPLTGKQTCPSQQSVTTAQLSSLDFHGEFTEELCTRPFDVMATDLEYINRDNLALTVLRTSLINVNTFTLTAEDPSKAEWVTLWVNPTTLETREDRMWMPEASSPALTAGTLCPSQRRMPNLGSLAAEAGVSVVTLVRLPLNVVLGFPVLANIATGQCPVVTRGHSLLKSCGAELLSLDDFFSAVFRCNTLFWQAFAIIADSFGPGAPQTFINGVAIAGENGGWAALLPGMAQQLTMVSKMGPSEAMGVLSNTVITLPAPVSAAKLATMNPIAYTQFAYLMGSRMLMQLLEAGAGERTLANVFWNVVSDGANDFELIVLQRMRMTCGGFSIMTGYGTPLGQMVNHWCVAWVEYQSGLLQMATTFFVDVPLVACICTASKGAHFATYVQSNCWDSAPDLQKPMLSALIETGNAACPTLVNLTQTQFQQSLDEMFARIEAGTREVGNVLDWFVHVNYEGDCNNFAASPYVLALIPQPVDYFRVCGKTDACRIRCLSEFQAFEARRSLATQSTDTVTRVVQSLFFNSLDQDSRRPLDPIAMLELWNCSAVCGFVQTVGAYSDRCFLLAGTSGAGMLQVMSFCVPVKIGASVRRGGAAWTVENLVPGAIQLGFVFVPDPFVFWNGFRLLALTDGGLWACHESCVQAWAASDFASDITRLKQFVILGNLVVVQALYADGVGFFTTATRSYCLQANFHGLGPPYLCESNVWVSATQRWPVCNTEANNLCTTVLLLPLAPAARLELCTRVGGSLQACVPYTTAHNFVYDSSLSNSEGVISQSSLLQGDGSVWQVFMTAGSDQLLHWLQLTKVALQGDGSATGSTHSSLDVSMRVTVLRPCSLDNCVGCLDLGLQRMCYAAQQCQLARCIGTMVHQRRPLCAIGMNLQAVLEQHLSLVQGAWLIISETVVEILALGGGVALPTSVNWPDQAFYGYVCAAKDVSATAISIVISAINGVVQTAGQVPVAAAASQGHLISNNAMILFTMTMEATTNFLNQIALYPLYNLIAMQKIYVCSANSILAVASQDQLTMTIGDPSIQNLSDIGSGRCMTQYFAENTQGEGSGTDNDNSLVSGAIGQLTNLALDLQLDFLMHPWDAFFTWMQGVVSGLQDVVETIDRNRCKLPDQSVKSSFQCACGDWPFRIVAERQQETWQDQAFWCSTTMNLMAYDGSTVYVWNPYSLGELKAMLGGLDDYLACVAAGDSCTPPSADVFDSQQVSMISVYQRCLANYQSRQWDMGAHVLFNASLQRLIQTPVPTPPCVPVPGWPCLSDCLLAAAAQGGSNAACLDAWLQGRNVASLDHFEYERVTGTTTSRDVHACQVFSGPADIEGAAGLPFRVCLDHYNDSGTCTLPLIVWSGRSTNKVPVGVDHSTVIADPQLRQVAAYNTYASIRSDVQAALDAVSRWNASDLKVTVFSAEGDLLHQYFDCMMVGALDSVALWPGPDGLETPVWSRGRHQASRDFELPCSGDALKDRKGNRDTQSPFTCGSDARRAAIKYFIRNRMQSGANQGLVQQAVQALAGQLRQAWLTDLSDYACQCANGTHSTDCCVLDPSCDPSTYTCACADGSPASYACCDAECQAGSLLPSRFQVPFTSVPGSQAMAGLLDDAKQYLASQVWTDNAPWLLWDDGGAAAYNWTETGPQAALDDGLHDSTSPVKAYDASEIGYPFRTTVWAQCHGLLHQIHFTMPVRGGTITTLGAPYDPAGVSQTVNMTYKEDFIRQLVQDAYRQSPLFWHYHARHRPSQSQVCARTEGRWPNTTNQSFFLWHGYGALTLGGAGVDCYCGWWFNRTHCQVPSAVCARLVLLLGTPELQAACAGGGLMPPSMIEDAMPRLVALEGGWKGWPCPAMQVSDHWGLLPDQTAWLKGGAPNATGVMDRILRDGPSGLRVGSLDWFLASQTGFLNPSMRREPIASQQCDLQPPASLVDHFVDELFPAAQGVRQSGAVSACLRFSVEVARQSAYLEAGLAVAAADQASVVATWRRRCERKLQQLALCETYGVFNLSGSSCSCSFQVDPHFDGHYSLTPGCLVLYGGVLYDPCGCDARWCGSSPSDFLNLITLTPACAVKHARDLVLDAGTGLPTWPATSTTAVPLPLARSTFYDAVLGPQSSNVANNPAGHWATAEGNRSSLYCDVVVDWWPDSWKHPVGYHVTLPCTGAAHRTFDASWAALRVGTQVTMWHVPTALRNQTMRTNQFGAAGACRTHNYGMPTQVVNSMRFCTQADNRAVDPSVPNASAAVPDWGVEYCTDSPFTVPWKGGPPSVGTFFDYLADMVPFDRWGPNAGDAPFKGCSADADCGAGSKCLAGKGAGVCARLQAGVFECAQHQHCTGQLCAGDGRCVQGVLEIHNNASFDISARVFSDQCAAPVDMWGVSKHDTVPDLLTSSGMCSYRSWFEHRRLLAAKPDGVIAGTDPWHFSSPSRRPQSAFDAGVLATLPHACDRDYEHLAGLSSCGVGGRPALRTQTYRANRTLPVVRHQQLSNLGAGFLGIPRTYDQLGFATAANPASAPQLRTCSAFGMCATQSNANVWFVNGQRQAVRNVTLASGAVRAYSLTDMMQCGAMGFVDGGLCRIDAAVAPLFYVYCTGAGTKPCTTYAGGLYPQGKGPADLWVVANDLNALFTSMRQPADTWARYLAAVDVAARYWTQIQSQAWLSAFPGAKVLHSYGGVAPKGLYYLMSYAAYELPFAWWFRCGWLSGLDVGPTATACPAWDGLDTPRRAPVSRQQWLASLNGIFNASILQDARNKAHQAFVDAVNAWNIPSIPFSCYAEAWLRTDISSRAYSDTAYSASSAGTAWPSVPLDVCSSAADCLDHRGDTVQASKDLVRQYLAAFTAAPPCTSGCACATHVVPSVCAFAQDVVPEQLPADQASLPLFQLAGAPVPSFAAGYDPQAGGCALVHCCAGNLGCRAPRALDQCACYTPSVTDEELLSAGIPSIHPEDPAWVAFWNQTGPPNPAGLEYLVTGDTWSALDPCGKSAGACTLADETKPDDCTPLANAAAQTVRNTYCAATPLYREADGRRCVYDKQGAPGLSCLRGRSIGGTRVSLKPVVSMEVFSVAPKPCWRMQCDFPMQNFDGLVVFDTRPYIDSSMIQVNVAQVRNKTHISEYVSISKSVNGSAFQTRLTSTTLPCALSEACAFNSMKTRRLSAAFRAPTVLTSTPSLGDMSDDAYTQLAADIVQSVEDALDDTTDAQLRPCLSKAPPNVAACSFTNAGAVSSLAIIGDCPDALMSTICTQMAAAACSGLSNEHRCKHFVSYEGCQVARVACMISLWCIIAGLPDCEADCLTDSDFSLCMASYDTLDKCRATTGLQCYSYGYQQSRSNVCTSSAVSGGCPYTEQGEADLQAAGLPAAGFCPDCIPTAWTSCPLTKSSHTYSLVEAANNLHAFRSQAASDGAQLPSDASHFALTLGTLASGAPLQCGEPACATTQRAVQLYRNMYACIDCFTVSPKFCSGNHLCRFLPWAATARDYPGYIDHIQVFEQGGSTYAQAFDAVRWLVSALQQQVAPAGVQPQWAPFLEPYGFAEYNPTTLRQTFNANIELLGSKCTSNSFLPDLSKCQNDLPRTTLRSFVQSQYKVQEGAVIGAGATFAWFVGQAQMLSTNIPAWSALPASPFFETLFDDGLCLQGTIDSLVCMKDSPSSMIALNPILSGRFEVQQGCDVADGVVDGLCNQLECPATDPGADAYNTFAGTNYFSLDNRTRCAIWNTQPPQFVTTSAKSPVNLCSKTPPTPAQCGAHQGMLGQTTWDGAAVATLYARQPWPAAYVPAGLLSGKNPLLAFKKLSTRVFGNITLDPWDIGGHYIRMTLGGTPDALLVTALPLRSYATLSDAAALNSTDWVAAWRAAAPAEVSLMADLYVMRTCRSWDCPLRRRYFWTGASSTFRPFVPNPARTQALFGQPTHPTAAPQPMPQGVLGRYQTRNGFCVCPIGDPCQPASGPCAAASTIKSLSDLQYRPALAVPSGTASTKQVDWPWTGGPLRDGATLPVRVSGVGVLDRLPPFQYRYANSKTVLDSPATTLDDGGDCHMGRPASASFALQQCTLVSKADDHMVLQCPDGSQTTIPRPRSENVIPKGLAPRIRCEACDPLPVFKAADGTPLAEPEVSYGQLWRWAPERKLAQDLRFRLCGNATECPMLRADLWKLGSFWAAAMKGGLTTAPPRPAASLEGLFKASKVESDQSDWSKPWLLCTTANGTECQGAISKADWLADRPGSCKRILDQPNADDASVDLTICQLDATLDQLCRTIQQARYRLFEANCQLAGACRTSAFFYQPATYSISNDQFVRETVQYFYNFTVGGSCPVHDAELAAILDQNHHTAKDCSAQSLQVMQFAIQAAREVVHFFVALCYYSGQIGMQLLSLIMTTNPQPIVHQIMFYLNQILAQFRQFFSTLGDLLYKMVMETGKLGQFLRDMVTAVCRFLRDVFQSVVKPFICFLKEVIMGILDAFETLLDGISVVFGGLGDFKDSVADTRAKLDERFNCDLENPFQCDALFDNNESLPSSLPMPTRCWVGYQPAVGDQHGLGCAASDTCMDDDGTFKACAACSGDVDMDRFGCDSLTKLCRCHTFPVGQTQCSSHRECLLPDTECGFVDAYLKPSFGNVPCARCSAQPLCLLTSSSIGQCVCLLRPTPTQVCSAVYAAQRVSPDPTQLCLVSLGLGIASSSTYSANWQDLASTPCAQLNGAQTWCLSVWQNSANSYMVVGLALLSSGSSRRLLGLESFVLATNASQWDRAHEPCRSLMASTPTSLLEKHVASECERWRSVGERAILLFNLSDADAVQFTTYLGVAESPGLSLRVLLFLAKHADWAQPLLVVTRRLWHRFLPALNASAIVIQNLVAASSDDKAPLLQRAVQDLLPWFATSSAMKSPTNATKSKSNASTTPRRLLSTWKDDLQAVRTFSVDIADGRVANLPPNIAASWNTGPFSWPPDYDYHTNQTCLAASIAYNITFYAMQSTIAFYTKTGPARPAINRTLAEALPQLPKAWTTLPTPPDEMQVVSFFRSRLNALLGIDLSVIKHYTSSSYNTPSQLSQDLSSLINCDFVAVQHCTKQRRSLWWGAILVAVAFLVLSLVARFAGLPFVDYALLVAYVPFTLWYVFGYSMTCLPLVPTCIADELLDVLQKLLPVSLAWPTQLQRWPGCLDGTQNPSFPSIAPASKDCFVSCTSPPFSFRTWEDSAAWLLCEVGLCSSDLVTNTWQPAVDRLAPSLPSWLVDAVHLDRLADALARKQPFLAWDDMRNAQTICFVFTLFNLVPFVLGAVLVLVTAFAAAALALALVQFLVNCLLIVFVFAHSR